MSKEQLFTFLALALGIFLAFALVLGALATKPGELESLQNIPMVVPVTIIASFIAAAFVIAMLIGEILMGPPPDR